MVKKLKQELKAFILSLVFILFFFFIFIPLVILFLFALKSNDFDFMVIYGSLLFIMICIFVLIIWIKNLKLMGVSKKNKIQLALVSIEKQESTYYGIIGTLAILGGIINAFRSIKNGEFGNSLLSIGITIVGIVFFLLRKAIAKKGISLLGKRLKNK